MRLFRKLLWALPIFVLINMFLYGKKQEGRASDKKPALKDVKVQQCEPCLEKEPDVSSCYDSCVEEAQSKPYLQGYAICENDLPKAYNAPGRIDACNGIDTYITGSFIYWELLGDQLDLGGLILTSTTPRNLKIVKFKTEFEPGFKIGLGFNFSHDNWDLYAQYTRLHETETTTFTMPSGAQGSFVTSWFQSDPAFSDIGLFNSSLRASWRMELDKLDLELARSYYLGTNLIARPFIGGSVHWLDQKYNINTTYNSDLYDNTVKNDSWAIGPRFGLGSNWIFYKGFRFFGNGVISLLFSKNKINQSGDEAGTSFGAYTMDKVDKNVLQDVLELQIGFGWGSYFTHDKWHFDLSVAYEAQKYGHTNYMADVSQVFSESNRIKPGDLFLHGLSLAARFDF